jgi:Flp pilus assembly protein TadD
MPTVQLASALYLERTYEAAIALCQQVLTLEPQFWAAALFLGQCHDVCGRASEAISWLRTASELSANNPLAVASLGHALARSGRSDDAAALISDLQRRSAMEYIPRYAFALICAGMGHDDEALRCLEEACDEQSPAVALWLGAEPRLDGLRSHRRFQELAERVGVA